MAQTLQLCDFPIKSYSRKSEHVLNFNTKCVIRFIFQFLKKKFQINIFYFNLIIINKFNLVIMMIDFIIKNIFKSILVNSLKNRKMIR